MPEGREKKAPRGVTAVRESLMQAARELLSIRPASQISGRAIAERAGVNYGLIHQYFGSKEKIYQEVFSRLSAEVTAIASATGVKDWWNQPTLLSTNGDAWRVVANLIADPSMMDEMDWDFPLMRAVAAGLSAEHPDWDPAEVAAQAGHLGATLLGWSLLEPIYQRGLGLAEERIGEIRDRILSLAISARD